MASNLPSWPGAEVCYPRAYAMLDRMAKAGHVRRERTRKRHGYVCVVSDDMAHVIKALDRGDEEAIKAALLYDRTVSAWPNGQSAPKAQA